MYFVLIGLMISSKDSSRWSWGVMWVLMSLQITFSCFMLLSVFQTSIKLQKPQLSWTFSEGFEIISHCQLAQHMFVNVFSVISYSWKRNSWLQKSSGTRLTAAQWKFGVGLFLFSVSDWVILLFPLYGDLVNFFFHPVAVLTARIRNYQEHLQKHHKVSEKSRIIISSFCLATEQHVLVTGLIRTFQMVCPVMWMLIWATEMSCVCIHLSIFPLCLLC